MKKLNFGIKKINIAYVKDYYDKNRQQVLTIFVVACCIFFLFYWTRELINSKKSNYEAAAATIYTTLETATNYAAQIKQAEATGGVNKMNTGLLVFVQTLGSDGGISAKLVNIRPINASGNVEHVSLRMENLYYDELINFLSRIENYDNLRVKTMSFSRRYDNPKMIDVTMEIVKS